jgi:hypothetical protein
MSTARKTLLAIWAGAFAVALGSHYLDKLFQGDGTFTPFDLIGFWARLIFLALTCYWVVVGFRWVLKKLFWRVGRRLALSYVLIGFLPRCCSSWGAIFSRACSARPP